jgi:3',5'-cyclic AMP phosphodiesterase CpdA
MRFPDSIGTKRRLILLLLGGLLAASPLDLKLPLKPKSVRFAVIGDSGTGDPPQYEVAAQMNAWRQVFPFDFVIMLGDNIYGGKTAADLKKKFEYPYGPLLDAGVKFYASLGNHDDTNERDYKPFNMGGKRYYSFKKGDVEFLALDSNYMDPEQMTWLTAQLAASKATWKICFFHHPLYSDGKFHGPNVDLRKQLEPLFTANGVSVVFSGHEHLYERIQPQKGITYFVLGSAGELRPHNLRQSSEMAAGFDTDRTFELVEISQDTLYFQTISRKGETVDSGVLENPRKTGNP